MSIDWSIKATDVAIIFTTVVGPILAVWAAEWRQKQKAASDRREWVFRTLMTTRGAKLSPDHVAAINHIEFAFPKSQHREVDDARALYRKHLRSPDSVSVELAIRQAWFNRANELFAEMLYRMATALGVPFPKSEITEESYHPDAFALTETELNEIRGLLLQVLKKGRPLNIRVVNEQPASSQETP